AIEERNVLTLSDPTSCPFLPLFPFLSILLLSFHLDTWTDRNKVEINQWFIRPGCTRTAPGRPDGLCVKPRKFTQRCVKMSGSVRVPPGRIYAALRKFMQPVRSA